MRLILNVSVSHGILAAIMSQAMKGVIHEINIGSENDDLGPVTSALCFIDSQAPDTGNVDSTSTGTGTTASPPSSAAPIPPVPTPPNGADDEGDEDEDESGGESDGTGVDADGLPWDERIHTSTKTKTAKGTWTKRRGGPKGAELAQIEAELRGSTAHGHPNSVEASYTEAPAAPTPQPMPAPAPAPAAPPPPIPAPVPPTPQPIPAPTPAVEQPATPAMPAAAAPAPAPAEAIAASMDFPSFMQQVGPKMGEGEGQINAAYLAQVCQMHGLNAITDLALKPEMIGQIVAQFQADSRW